jgi:hypothetical protein
MKQTVSIDGFAGGINRRLPVSDIADNELVTALNVELDRRAQLRVRNGVTKLFTTSGDAVKSLFHYRLSGGTDTVVGNWGANVYRFAAGGGSATSITGGLTIPSGATWYWTVFNDVLIGVNGATTGDATVKLTSAAGTLAALGGSPPRGKFCETWNNRVWIVDANNPNVLKGSALGLHEDWSATGRAGTVSLAVGGNEGDLITGIKAHRGMLFIFKRRYIYVLVPGSPNTDVSQYEVRMISDRVGHVGGATIQPLFDDLLFLSDYGVMSLDAVQQFGEYDRAVLTDKLPEVSSLPKATTPYASIVHPGKGQYWLSVPTTTSGGANALVYVYDAANRAWTNFDGLVAGASYAVVYESGVPYVYVGGAAGSVYRYDVDASTTFTDDSTLYKKDIVTKAYSFGEQLVRKEAFEYGIEFGAETATVPLLISYRFDEVDSKMKTKQISFTQVGTGGAWDIAQWDSGVWASELSANLMLVRTFRGFPGRRFRTLQFRVQCVTDAIGFTLKRIAVDVAPLNRIHITSA